MTQATFYNVTKLQMNCLFAEVFFMCQWHWAHVGKYVVKVNKPLEAAGMSADNVRKLNIWPKSKASKAN